MVRLLFLNKLRKAIDSVTDISIIGKLLLLSLEMW